MRRVVVILGRQIAINVPLSKRKLKKLASSPIPADRRIVAQEGHMLDVLVHDPHSFVREAVARRGYGLDILIHDEDYRVRCTVAKLGYGLDILAHDEHPSVRDMVRAAKLKQEEE